MRNTVIMTITSKEELDLIVSALAAYNHNPRYRALYEKLVRQQDQQKMLSA